ncbi:hypothetical protein L7F22_007695 [Adiantum nelumboides]|nr:hypothetical protein [Adiantum nelumboides]
MAWSDFLIFSGVEEAEAWLQDYGLFLLEIGLSKHEDVLQVFLSVDAQLHEVKRKLDGLKQRLDGDFQAFKWEFEALWRKLIEVTATQNSDYLKLSKFMDCLHEDVQDKVEVDNPTTYAEAVAYARGRTKKLLKKRQASQGMSSAFVSKPVEAVVVKTESVLETLPAIQEEPRVLWLQRDEVISMPKMPTKEVQIVEEPFESMNEVDNTQACSEEEVEADSSSSMDTDAGWETDLSCSSYENIDILHVDRAMEEDVFEEQCKVQEDVLDADLMKESMLTDRDIQIKVVLQTIDKRKGKSKDNDGKEEKSKSSVKIEKINVVFYACDVQGINMLIEIDDVFFDAHESLLLHSLFPSELLISGEVSHTWILDLGASLHVTLHREWFTTYEETIGSATLGDNYACDIVGVDDVAMVMANGLDGVASQSKAKRPSYFVGRYAGFIGKVMVWNFFGSGHNKGEHDGAEAVVKRVLTWYDLPSITKPCTSY